MDSPVIHLLITGPGSSPSYRTEGAGERVPAGHKEQRGGGHHRAGQEEDGAGPPGHPAHGHHGQTALQDWPGKDFEFIQNKFLGLEILYNSAHPYVTGGGSLVN